MTSLKLDLGSGRQAGEAPGYVHIDKIWSEGVDILYDLENGLPPKQSMADTVDEIRAHHICEHLSNDGFMKLMDAMWIALKPDGILKIYVPNTEHRQAARGDPTHKMEFHQTTFKYFTRESLVAFPYTDKPWKIVEGPEIRGSEGDWWEIYVVMTPDK